MTRKIFASILVNLILFTGFKPFPPISQTEYVYICNGPNQSSITTRRIAGA